MKEGKTVQELAKTLQNIKETARDFVVPTSKLEAVSSGSSVSLGFENGEMRTFAMNNYTGGQVAGFTGIPTQYFRRLESENAGLLAKNINHGLRVIEKDKPKRMLRTFTDSGTPLMRGFMSNKFFRLDNFDMFEAVYPIFEKHGLSIVSSELTDRKMYLKVLSPKLKTEIVVGDTVQFGIVISNSDVGAGSARIEPLLYRLICKNGVISNAALTKYHIGKSASESQAYELYSDAKRNMDAKAFFMKVVDLIEGSLRKDVFEAEVDKIKRAMNDNIDEKAEPEKVIELSMKATGISGEGKKKSILSALASGNDGAGYTRWGMVNSFTRVAQDESISYEESIELERAGGKILELSPASWKHIASVN